MLILTRRVSETVIIGEHQIDITVLGIKGYQVRLGITADKNIPIHREEVYERIQTDKAKKKAEKVDDKQ